MSRGAVVTGRVTDPDGEPAPNVSVMVYTATRSLRAGSRHVLHRQGPTDDLGQFRFHNLQPGTYLMAADPQAIRGVGDHVDWQGTDTHDLVMTFAPGTPGVSGAQLVVLEAGQETSVDIQLLTGRLVTLAGRVLDSRGQVLDRGSLRLIPDEPDAVGGSHKSTSLRQGTFQVGGLRPGPYRIVVWAQSPPGPPETPLSLDAHADVESADVSLLVGDADITGLAITTSPPSTATGRLVVEGDRSALRGHAFQVSGFTSQPDRMPGPMSRGHVREDGTVQVRGLRGRQVLHVSGLPAGWWVKAVRINGDDALYGFDFGAGHQFTDLEVVVSDRPVALGGRVTTPSGEPAVDVTVAVIPENLEALGGFVVPGLGGPVRTDQHGHFLLTGIRPGVYYVSADARPDIPGMFFDDLDAFRELTARAIRVTVAEGRPEHVELTLTSP